jgi:hypothetical protein
VGIESPDTFAYTFSLSGYDPAAADANLRAQRGIGVGIHRQQFKWQDIERSRGRYDFEAFGYDRYMDRMAANGMRVLPVLFDAPRWHTAKGEKLGKGIVGRPKSGRALGKFAAAVIKRYGPKGSFWRGRPASQKRASAIRSLQLWNEPNLRFYWSGRPKAKQYVAVLKGAYPQIKRANRSVEVVTAGIPQSSTARAVPLKKYIQQMYRAGAKKWFDTFGLNAYARNAKDLGRKLRLVRDQMRKGRDGKAKLWITEIGWADTGNRHYLVKGAKGQAREITKSIALIKKQRKRSRLRGFIYYQWRDAPPAGSRVDPGTWGFHAGLLKENGSRKRAFNAFRAAVNKL